MTAWVKALLNWYYRARREMPWRGHPDPYAVWVSEIMLQQTQVDTVRPYFDRFLKTFPDITTLAAASDETLLKSWEGLGYYTRVRNLRKAAQHLVATNKATLPSTAIALQALPGIGPYTAAAIASICFAEAIPVVDGNVARVFARVNLLTDDFSKEVHRRTLAKWLTPFIQEVSTPGDFNQAMMELGALICTPHAPQCADCPLANICQAHATHRQVEFPIIPKRKTLPERKRSVLFLQNTDGEILFSKHTGERLLDGFWELPELRTLPIAHTTPKKVYQHKQTFSHFRQILTVYAARLTEATHLPEDVVWSSAPETLPLTTATRQILAALHTTPKTSQKAKRTPSKDKKAPL